MFLDARTKYLLYGGCFSPIFDLETLGGALIREGALIRDNTVYLHRSATPEDGVVFGVNFGLK